VLCHHHGIPMYVAAPLSTVDYELSGGQGIPIEERDPFEVSHLAGLAERSATPAGVRIHRPAFDVTPAGLLSGIITEVGVALPPFEVSLAQWRSQAGRMR